MQNKIYLDNSATTKPFDEVVDEMMVVLREEYGNPSSSHTMGLNAEKLMKSSRERIAKVIKCNLNELIFTSGGTEANNLAIRGTVLANSRRGNHIITTKIEHDSVLNTFKCLEKEGYKVTYLNVSNEGIVDLKELENTISADTIFVSIMHVNSETGTIQPIEYISKLIKNKNVIFHTDAVQSFGKILTNVNELGVDLMTISSHKIHGPKGVGAIYIKKGTNISSLILGGGQEGNIRAGTENIPGIIGFGKAASIQKDMIQIEKLRNHLQDNIISKINDTFVNGSVENRVPHILNISFLGVRGEVLLNALTNEGIFVSTGSACSSKKNIFSHVLGAMGIDDARKEGAIRFSLGVLNTKEEIDICIEKLIPIVQQLRRFKRR